MNIIIIVRYIINSYFKFNSLPTRNMTDFFFEKYTMEESNNWINTCKNNTKFKFH